MERTRVQQTHELTGPRVVIGQPIPCWVLLPRALPLAAMLLLVVPIGRGHAQENRGDDDAAKAHFAAGRTLYDAGRFESAADEFFEAYQLSGRPELLFNLYVAQRDAGQTEAATMSLERYLETVGDIEDRANLEARLETLQRQAASRAPSGSESTLDAREGEAVASSSANASRSNRLPRVAMVVGGTLLVGSLVTGILAAGKASNLDNSCPDNRCPADFDLEDARSQAESLATITDVLFLSGALVAGLGITLAVASNNRERHPSETRTASRRFRRPLRMAFACTPRLCATQLQGSF